jgi:hypothetical protein
MQSSCELQADIFRAQKGEGFVMWSDSFFYNYMQHEKTAIFAATAVLL